MFSNKDEEALPLVEILLREQEPLPTRRRRCSEDSVRHYPSRGPLPDSGIAHDTLKKGGSLSAHVEEDTRMSFACRS